MHENFLDQSPGPFLGPCMIWCVRYLIWMRIGSLLRVAHQSFNYLLMNLNLFEEINYTKGIFGLTVSNMVFPSSSLPFFDFLFCSLFSLVLLFTMLLIKEAHGGDPAFIKCLLSMRHYTRHITSVSDILN